MSKIKKLLFKRLNQAYNGKVVWKEVEAELKAAGRSSNTNKDFLDPFKNLIIGILSQNTSDANSVKAWIGLTEKFKITPQTLAKADVRKIRNSIKPGGLYNLKSKRIKACSKAILKKFNGDLNQLAKMPKDQAREELLNLSGIGVKTADIWLAYCSQHQVVAVDTHVNRVAKRLGIIPKNASYEKIREILEKIFKPKERTQGHEYLVRLGRDYCKPKNPLCKICPIENLCSKKV